MVISILWTSFNNKVFKPICIQAEDNVSEIAVESIVQTAYIRSTFATVEQLVQINSKVIDYASKEATRWEASGFGYLFLRALTFGSVIIIAMMIMTEVQTKNLTVATGLALITTYFISVSNIRNVGEQVKRLTASHSRITDLFTFMQGFGKQTFPVLEEKNKNLK